MRPAPLASVVIAALLGTLHAQPERPQPSFARAEAAILAEMRKAGIPGAAVAVVVGDRVVWTAGLGVANAETQAPVTADTLFQIGSVTKSFTAAALLTAASEGRLALDRPVSTYVKGLTPCVGAPTLTQLLSHTGGLIDEPDEFGPQGEDGLGAYQRTWTSEYCLLPPGRAFSYSNSGFALAGRRVLLLGAGGAAAGALGPLRVTVKPSSDSVTVSPLPLMVMTLLTSPIAKFTVPLGNAPPKSAALAGLAPLPLTA